MTHLNFKYNPVTSNQIEYYKQIRDNCPLIEELDDEPVEENFFETKMALPKITKQISDFLSLKIPQWFLKMGLSEEILRVLNTV